MVFKLCFDLFKFAYQILYGRCIRVKEETPGFWGASLMFSLHTGHNGRCAQEPGAKPSATDDAAGIRSS